MIGHCHPPNPLLADLADKLDLCIRCGTCRPVCPSFAATMRETRSPRGRIFLSHAYLNGELKTSTELAHCLNTCLNCKSCEFVCPNNIPITDVILLGRNKLVASSKIPLLKRISFWLLARPRLFNRLMKILAWCLDVIFRGLPRRSPVRLLFLLFGWRRDRVIPTLSRIPLRDRFPEIIPAVTKRRYRVGFFTGCANNFIYTGVGESVIKILTQHGVEVVIPHDQVCSGTPVFNAGDFEAAKKMVRQNIRAFNRFPDLDAVITACSSCGLALKHEWKHLLKMDRELDFGVLDKNIYDISEFLEQFIELKTVALSPIVRVTYHDPCHLGPRGQGVTEEPRRLLHQLAQNHYYELPDASRCCGCAGTFSLSYYPLAVEIAQRKTDAISQTPATIVATGCPSCIMHITDLVHKNDLNVQVKHTVEILAENLARE